LPIVHVNGFKISERTIYGTMDDAELVALFSGYGYQVRFVEDLDNIDADLASSMSWAVDVIRGIQKKAREGNAEVKPRWPVLIMRTPKGWGVPKVYNGQFIEGSYKSHQVPFPLPHEDDEQLQLVKGWLQSYKIHELIDPETGLPDKELLSIVPTTLHKKMGMRKEAFRSYEPLQLPEWKPLAVEKGSQQSCMKITGEFLHDVVEQ
jgi:xylulose-5-phosphate/fructose-6-phosphate phosphoketolase